MQSDGQTRVYRSGSPPMVLGFVWAPASRTTRARNARRQISCIVLADRKISNMICGRQFRRQQHATASNGTLAVNAVAGLVIPTPQPRAQTPACAMNSTDDVSFPGDD